MLVLYSNKNILKTHEGKCIFTKIIRKVANTSDVLLILVLSVTSCFSSSKSPSLGKSKSDEKDAQKLKKMEREEKEFRKKFKVSFFHIKHKD